MQRVRGFGEDALHKYTTCRYKCFVLIPFIVRLTAVGICGKKFAAAAMPP